MTNEQKANELGFKFFPDEENIWARANVEATKCAFACLGMAQWKDEQFKHLLIEKTKLLSSSAAQDSVKRCTIEEIYRELFNKELPNSNPYIK